MHPDKNGDVKKYPHKEIRGEEGISLKLMRMGGELYPHLLLEAKVDVLEEIAGLTAKKTKSRATAKFNLDSPQGFFHASNITVGHPEPSKKCPDGGTVRFTFMSRYGATTERCDVVDPEYSDETKTTLSLMQSMQKSGKVDLVLHYYGSKSLQRLLATLEDFKNHRPHNWLPYIYNRNRTAATVFGSHHRREDVLNTVLYDNKLYVLAKIPRVLAFRDPLEMEVRLSTSAIIEWEYQRSLFEALGRVEHRAQFVILSPETTVIHLMLAAILKTDELIFDENVVLQVSWLPQNAYQDKIQRTTAIIQDGYFQVADRRGTITLLVLGDSAQKFASIASTSLETARIVNHVRVVAKFESKQLSQDTLAMRKFHNHGQRYHNFFLNQSATKGKRSDPTANCGLPKAEVNKIFEDVCRIAGLNKGQIEAMEACRNLLDLFMLIWGPAGTGKTWVAATFAAFLLQCGVYVVGLAPSNAAANQLMTSIMAVQDKLEKAGRRVPDFEKPLMINRGTAETAQLDRYGDELRPDQELDERQQARVLSWEEQAAKFASQVETFTNVKLRRRKRGMEHSDKSITAAVIALANAGSIQVLSKWPGASEADPEIDMVPHVKAYLDKLAVKRFSDWKNDDKKKFNIAFATVRDRVVADQHCVTATFATMYSDIMKPFASGESAEGPPVALFMDEQSMTPEIRTILACVTPTFWKRIAAIILLGDHEQLPVLLLSKDFNEHAGQGELSTYERKMKAGFEVATLNENMRMHPRVLAYPNRKKYGGNLQATEEAASRQFHPVYAKLMCAYLDEDDPANIHVYAVDIAEAETFTSVYSKSRSNLHTAHEIVNLVMMLRRSLEPSDFSLPDNIVILASHKDQVRTILRVLADKMRTHNITEKDETKRFKRAEFPDVTTIDSFQGKDKMIVFWDHVISRAEKSSDVGFLKEDRRVNVAATRAKLQLVIFTRIDMVQEPFFAYQAGKEIDWDTGEQVLKEKFYLSEYLLEILKKELYVPKQVNITIEEISQHQSWVGTGVAGSPNTRDDEDDVSQDGTCSA